MFQSAEQCPWSIAPPSTAPSITTDESPPAKARPNKPVSPDNSSGHLRPAMPVVKQMLKWDPIAVMSCLEVLPVEYEDAAGIGYTVMKSGMRLELMVYPYHGDVSVSLYRDGVIDPALSLNLFGCDAIRCIQFKGYDALEFGAGRLFAGRYDGDGPIPYGFRIRVKPSIAIDTFRYPV